MITEVNHRFIETNGIRMHVAEQGSGPLVVLCHGFPESWYSWRHQIRALAEAGSSMLAIPSAFTRQTGEAHWHVLVRARAIENGSFVFAAAQGGRHENGRETYGHSLIVDPWGRILGEGSVEPGIVLAEIDPAAVAAARGRVPSLQHGRRFEMTAPMAGPLPFRAVGEPR